jgi:hypothetical protein
MSVDGDVVVVAVVVVVVKGYPTVTSEFLHDYWWGRMYIVIASPQ